MSHDEQLIKTGFASMQMSRPAQAIIASGDARRRRHRATGASALLVAVGAGAAVAVAGVGPVTGHGHATAGPRVSSSPPAGTSQAQAPRVSHQQIDVEMAGFSVQSHADGSVDLTIGDLSDAAKLRQVLASVGAPAVVTVNKYCDAPTSPIMSPDDWRLKAVSNAQPTNLKPGESVADWRDFVLHPAELHPGWKYGFSVFSSGGATVGLLPPDVPVTCHT